MTMMLDVPDDSDLDDLPPEVARRRLAIRQQVRRDTAAKERSFEPEDY